MRIVGEPLTNFWGQICPSSDIGFEVLQDADYFVACCSLSDEHFVRLLPSLSWMKDPLLGPVSIVSRSISSSSNCLFILLFPRQHSYKEHTHFWWVWLQRLLKTCSPFWSPTPLVIWGSSRRNCQWCTFTLEHYFFVSHDDRKPYTPF